jgi:hypothetical protein
MAFVSTLGASDANSYLSVAEATALLSGLPVSPGVTAWLALTNTEKEQTLVAATMAINPLKWKGRPVANNQSLAWPRVVTADHFAVSSSDLPLDFQIGVAYMAAFLGETGGYTGIQDLDGGSQRRENEQYDEVELGRGDLRVKFNNTGSLQAGSQYIPPFCMDIFRRYMNDSSFHQPRVSREPSARINPYGPGSAFRPSNIRVMNGLVYPAEGGWASNPL